MAKKVSVYGGTKWQRAGAPEIPEGSIKQRSRGIEGPAFRPTIGSRMFEAKPLAVPFARS